MSLNYFRSKIPFHELQLNSSDIGNAIGYKQGEVPDHIYSLIRETLIKASKICDVKVEYTVFKDVTFRKSNYSVIIRNTSFRINKIIFGQLQASESIAVFLCTAGEKISSLSKEISKEGDILEGYILDTIGSEIADTAAEVLQNRLKSEVAHIGENITNRFSPGYCGWNLSEQHELFGLMPDNYCGIKLTDSSLMIPTKSVSGIIGIGKEVRFAPYKCKICNDKNCIYRNKKK